MTVQVPHLSSPQALPRRLHDRMWSAVLTGTLLPRWLLRLGPTVFTLAVLAHGVTVVIWHQPQWRLIDLRVYQAAGDALIHGTPLYQHGVFGPMWFVYPPVAAIIFTPLVLVPPFLATVLYAVVNLALLVLAIRACWRTLGLRPGAHLRNVTLFSSGLVLWLEPVRTTLYLGQINVLLLALVLLDLLRHGRRWQGIGLGIAAGIKLTPLVFLPYLLLTRRFRAAAVAAGTFLGTILLGFLVTPRDSAMFWLRGTFADASRMAQVDGGSNHSLHGLLARQFGLTSRTELLWLASAAVLGSAGIAVAALAARRGHELFGVALTGLVGTAVSPFSWGHHWVWFAPLAVFLIHRVARKPAPARWLALLTLYAATCAVSTELPSMHGGFPPAGLVSLQPPGWLGWLCQNAYSLLFVGVTLVAASTLLRAKGTQRRASLRAPRQYEDGNREAFGELFDRHVEAVWNYAYRLTASWASAEDLTCNAFLTAWRRRSEAILVRDSALPWLYAIVGELAHAGRRKLARFRPALPRSAANDAIADHAILGDAIADVDNDDWLCQVLDIVARLPNVERMPVELCVLGELATADVAELLGVTDATVQSHISRAQRHVEKLSGQPVDSR